MALLVNANVLKNEFVWDDAIAFSGQTIQTQTTGGSSPPPVVYYRPLIDWSYRADFAIWGRNPFGFHLSVYLAHALTALLFFFVMRHIARLYQKNETIALWAAGLFAVHPIHSEAVAWISGRNDVFMALFMMIAMHAYLCYRQGIASRMMPAFFIPALFLSLLGKETAIPFLFIFPVMDFLFHRNGIFQRPSIKDPLTAVWIVGFCAFVLYRFLGIGLPQPQTDGVGPPGAGVTTPFIALGYYVKLLLIPYPLNLLVDTVPGGTPGAFYFLVGLAGLVFMVWGAVRWRGTPFAAGAAWFSLGMAAPLIVPFMTVSVTPIAERYAYLASGGFFLLIGMGIDQAGRWIRSRPDPLLPARRAWLLPAMILGLFSCLAWERNGVWRNETALWEDAVQTSPRAVLPHYNLANIYRYHRRLKEAAAEYETALRLKPDHAGAHFNLGFTYNTLGRTDEAVREFRAVLELKPDYAEARLHLGNILADQGRREEAVREYLSALASNPNLAETHNNLGTVYKDLGRVEDAVLEFQTAIRLAPERPHAHYNLGLAYAGQGRFEEAVQEYRTVIRLDPANADAHAHLGTIYLNRNQIQESLEAYEAALRSNPNHVDANYNLGIVYLKMGRREPAKQQFLKALQLKPDFPQARSALEKLTQP